VSTSNSRSDPYRRPRATRASPGLRWVVVLVPAGVVLVLELLSDSVLDEALPFPWDTILVTAAVLVIGLILARLAFARIDALTGTLRARNAELEARGASARALHRVSVQIAALTDVDRVLEAVVSHARELLGADVAVLLLEDPQGQLQLRAASGPPDALRPSAQSPAGFDGDGGPGEVVTNGQPSGDGADAMLRFVQPAAAAVRLSAPLQRGGQTIGLLAIGVASPRGFDTEEVETLASLANQATIALEHARLEARLRELAVIEERERIARELHDGIAQVLGYVNTKSQAVDGYLSMGRIDAARSQLADMAAAARAEYLDVREAILGLRSPIEPGQGLGPAIEAHARRVAQASQFRLEASIEPAAHELRLAPDAEAQLYRIVQEALTNVRKHASADCVRVSMRIVDDCLELVVEDDGRGLAAAGATGDMPHYGLRSMRERAAVVGATLDLEERSGGGVRVTVRLAVADHDADVPAAADMGAPSTGVATRAAGAPVPPPGAPAAAEGTPAAAVEER
jgi:signal transduction histidine kinase